MNQAKLFLGDPIRFKDICYIFPPTVKDIVSNEEYFYFLHSLVISQEDIWDSIQKQGKEIAQAPTPFEMLLLNALHDSNGREMIEKALKFFTKEEVRILPGQEMILFVERIDEAKTTEDLRYIGKEDFFEFQNIIRLATGSSIIDEPNIEEDPRVARIKAKARERDRIKQQKGIGGVELKTSLASLCCMGLGINPLNIGEISYVSMVTLLRTYQEQEKYRVDMQLIAGGADPKKIKPKYWIRNLED